MNNIYQQLVSICALLMDFNNYSIIFRICLAMFVGSIIGSERGRHGRAAGIRTHTLVCLGAALTVIVGMYSVICLGMAGDPMRISAQVISGIGFLGAGTIMTRNHFQITGLTTAAGLWTTAAIGLAIGVGFYLGALAGFLALEITITLLNSRSRRKHRHLPDTYYLELIGAECINTFSDEFDTHDTSLQIIRAKTGISNHVGIIFALNTPEDPAILLKRFRDLEYVVIAVPQNA